MSSSLDNEYPYIGNNTKPDLDTVIMQDELVKLQRKYNDSKSKLFDLNDEKAMQVSDIINNNNEPSTNIPQTISLEVNPQISNKYQHSIYGPSPVPESESCEIDNQTLYDSFCSITITPSITPTYSLPKSSHQLIIPNDYKQTVYKLKPMPNKPIPPTPTKQQQIKNNIITAPNTNALNMNEVKWVTFIARVRCHQSKQMYKIFNYHKNGYKENGNNIMDKLHSIDKNIENGSLIIDGYKLFAFIRNINCRFPFEMLLRTNNDNQYDAMQFLNKIGNQTKYSIDQMNIYDIATFDYNLHFDNTMHKLITLPKCSTTFYIQNQYK